MSPIKFSRAAVIAAACAASIIFMDAGSANAQYYGFPDQQIRRPSQWFLNGDPEAADPRFEMDRGLDADSYTMDEDQPRRRPRARRLERGADDPAARSAQLPRDADPAWSTPADYDLDVDPNLKTARRIVDPTGAAPGDITIDTRTRKLFLSLENGDAIEYGVGVGRQGFLWKGAAQIGRKAFWPGWTPPPEMLLRRPELPDHMEGGIDNPLGARALYLFNGSRDTMFRIHGTNEPDSIGKAVSSGCIRMLNADVIDLYGRVGKGTRVVVR